MNELLKIVHILGLALGLGTSFANLFLGISRSKMPKEEAMKDALRTMSLGIMGNIGTVLLVVSGIFLMGPYWNSLFDEPLLMIKLTLVIILLVLLTILNINSMKVQKEKGGPGLLKIKKIGQITLPIAVIIVVLAVIIFH